MHAELPRLARWLKAVAAIAAARRLSAQELDRVALVRMRLRECRRVLGMVV